MNLYLDRNPKYIIHGEVKKLSHLTVIIIYKKL
jgi:hypothetical protein